VFSNGLGTWEDGRVFIYFGACDENACLLEATVVELLASLDVARRQFGVSAELDLCCWPVCDRRAHG